MAFVSGYDAGFIDAKLEAVKSVSATFTRTIRAELFKQIDLIAAHHGYTLVIGTFDDSEEWVSVTFIPAGDTLDEMNLGLKEDGGD